MYKSKLQELCQKRAWSLPEYNTSKLGLDHNPQFQATVLVNGLTFQSPNLCRTSKEAQNDAANVAFRHFTTAVPDALNTTLDSGGNISNKTLQPQSVDYGRLKDTHHLYKNLLQNFAQKREFHLPVYSCECEGPPHARRFKCKVIVNGKTFESSESFSTVKDAEHTAAKIALTSLSQDGLEEEDSSFYKNLLQELAQKKGCPMPVYTTTRSGEAHAPIFVSSVDMDGETFTGQHTRTKKQAEISAAKVAFTILKEPKSNRNSTSSTPANQEKEVPELSGLHSTVNCDPQQNTGPQVHLLRNSSLTSSEPAAVYRENVSCDNFQLRSFPQPEMADLTSVSCSSHTMVLPPPEVGHSSACSPPEFFFTTNSSNELPAESRTSRNRVIVCPRVRNMTFPPHSIVLPFSDDNWVAVKLVSSANN